MQAISNQLMREFGALRHTFSKGPEGIIHLHFEYEPAHEIIGKLSQFLSDSWHRYTFAIKAVNTLPTTHTGKIKVGQN